jgi:uncharacterized protein (TIGR02231 family)
MRHLLAFLLLTIFSTASAKAQLAREEKVQHTLQSVRVYFSRAELTHEAKVNLSPGTYNLVFSGLSQYLDESSLQVGGDGDGIIQGVSARTSYLNRTVKNERVRILEDSLEFYSKKYYDVENIIWVLEREQDLILNNNRVAGQEKGLSTEELQKLAEFYRTRIRAIGISLLDYRDQKKLVDQHLARIRNELHKFNSERDQPTKEVVVAFVKRTNAPVSLKLKYLAENASWYPHYDLRCTKINEPVNLFLKGKIVNRTGIEWKNVTISLSTADPNSFASAPTLDPLYLYIRPPQPKPYAVKGKAIYQNAPPQQEIQYNEKLMERGGRTAEDAKRQRDALSAPAAESADEEAFSSADYTTTHSKSLATEYTIELPYTIPTDGKEMNVEVKKIEMPGKFRYFAIPKKSNDAYLQLQLTDWNTYDLIAGQASVYFEGNFVSKTAIEPSSADDTLYVDLGKDPKVVIERKLDKKYSSQKSLGSQVKLERTFKINLKNNKNEPINLIIEDQVPVSSGNQIEVEFHHAKEAKYDPTSGKLKWELELESGRSKTLEISYDIKFPKGMVLYSGDGGADY